jgi:hypothetical protein
MSLITSFSRTDKYPAPYLGSPGERFLHYFDIKFKPPGRFSHDFRLDKTRIDQRHDDLLFWRFRDLIR